MATPTPPPSEAPVTRRWPWKIIAAVVAVAVVVAAVAVYLALPKAGPKVVTYAVTSEMVTLDPSTEFSNSILVLSNAYEPLTWFDAVSQHAKPGLATSWSSSTDGLNWTFNLRTGVKFHDGTPFTANAVKFSIDRTMRMNQGAAFIWLPVKSVDVVSDTQVHFGLNYPAPMDWIASADYGAWIFSPNTPGANDTNQADWFNAGHDSGSGPWTINTAQYTNSHVVLDRFADYWGGWRAGQFDHAVIKVIADAAQREAAVVSGDVDVTIDVPVQDLPTLRQNTKVSVQVTPSYRTIYVFFNDVRAPTNSLAVRKALATAIPYDDVVNAVLNGLGSRSVGIVPAGMWGHDDTLPKYSFDLTAARNFMTQAGFPNGGFTLKLTYTLGDPFERGFAELYKEKLGTLGITLDIQPMPWEQQWGLAKGDPAVAQDIFVMYWWPTYVTPYDFLFNMFHSASYQFFNLGYYQNPTFDSTIDSASALEATNRPQALTDYRNAQVMLYNDVPAVGLVDLKNLYVTKANLAGLNDNAAYPLVVFFYQLSS